MGFKEIIVFCELTQRVFKNWASFAENKVSHKKTLFPSSIENLSASENAVFHARIQVHKVIDPIVQDYILQNNKPVQFQKCLLAIKCKIEDNAKTLFILDLYFNVKITQNQHIFCCIFFCHLAQILVVRMIHKTNT